MRIALIDRATAVTPKRQERTFNPLLPLDLILNGLTMMGSQLSNVGGIPSIVQEV